MYDEPFHPNPWVRRLNTSWPVFTAFRVRVRVSWTVVLIPFFFALGFAKSWSMSAGDALLWGAIWTLGLYATTWFHEMGHIWMGRRCGIETERMTLRALGGLAHLDAPAQSPKDEILVSLAGPATHLVWIAALFPLVRLLESAHGGEVWFAMLAGFAWYQVWMAVFNLLPIYPMDGGRTLRGAMTFRMHGTRASYIVANVGFVGNGAFVVLGLLGWLKLWDPLAWGSWGFLLMWIGVEGIQACRRLRLEALYGGDGFGDHDPFQKTLLASQAALRDADRDDHKERESRRVAAEERRRLEETTDRLLDRINEVGGIDKLSPGERKELERASRALAENRR